MAWSWAGILGFIAILGASLVSRIITML
jgi:hypothetical protein